MKKLFMKIRAKLYTKKHSKVFDEIKNDCFIALYGKHLFESKAKYYINESDAVKKVMDADEFKTLDKSAAENLDEDFENVRKNMKIIIKRPGKVYRFIDVIADDLKLTSELMIRYFGDDPTVKEISKEYHIGIITSMESTMKTVDMKKPNVYLNKQTVCGTVGFVDMSSENLSGLKPHQELFVDKFIEKIAIR